MGDPTSSCATVGIALGVIGTRKPLYLVKVDARQRGDGVQLGYANEVGESFRVLVPVSVVRFSYAVATAYVVADSADKGYLMWKKPFLDEKTKYRQVAIATGDTLIWQGLASVAIPGFTINRICWATRHALASIKFLPRPMKIWGVVAAGLGSIPFIVHPIDRGTDWLLDNSIRKYYRSS